MEKCLEVIASARPEFWLHSGGDVVAGLKDLARLRVGHAVGVPRDVEARVIGQCRSVAASALAAVGRGATATGGKPLEPPQVSEQVSKVLAVARLATAGVLDLTDTADVYAAVAAHKAALRQACSGSQQVRLGNVRGRGSAGGRSCDITQPPCAPHAG